MSVLEKRGVEIHKIIEFTDQAPSKYKNKTAFRYLTQQDIPCQRNFFGVRHGKGPCDTCAGRVKSRLSALVHSETVIINDAKTCYQAAKEYLESHWPDKSECMHYILSVNFTPKNPKHPDTSKWKGVENTREYMHQL